MPRTRRRLLARLGGASALLGLALLGFGLRPRPPAPAPPPHAVAAAASPAPPPSAAPPARDAEAPLQHDPFAIRPVPVLPGTAFTVIVPFAGGARVTITRDADDARVGSATIARDARSTVIVAPPRGAYTVVVRAREGDRRLARPLPYAGS